MSELGSFESVSGGRGERRLVECRQTAAVRHTPAVFRDCCNRARSGHARFKWPVKCSCTGHTRLSTDCGHSRPPISLADRGHEAVLEQATPANVSQASSSGPALRIGGAIETTLPCLLSTTARFHALCLLQRAQHVCITRLSPRLSLTARPHWQQQCAPLSLARRAMGICASSAEDAAARRKHERAKRRHRTRQRSDSSLSPSDPAAVVHVAHITPRMSLDYEPPCEPAEQQPAGETECHCHYEAEHKDESHDDAILSAMIVIESPPPNNRELLLTAADMEGRPASSSHSAEAPPDAAETITPTTDNFSPHPPLTPDSSHTPLPHSAVSLPASPFTGTTPAKPPRTSLASLSANSSPKLSFSSPPPHATHSRSHSVVGAPCPTHARSHSLSILQVLQEVNHSRNSSVVFSGEHVLKEEETKEESEAGGVGDGWKGTMEGEEEKTSCVDDMPSPPVSFERARIATIDNRLCAL